jgi:hypothetical protein
MATVHMLSQYQCLQDNKGQWVPCRKVVVLQALLLAHAALVSAHALIFLATSPDKVSCC